MVTARLNIQVAYRKNLNCATALMFGLCRTMGAASLAIHSKRTGRRGSRICFNLKLLNCQEGFCSFLFFARSHFFRSSLPLAIASKSFLLCSLIRAINCSGTLPIYSEETVILVICEESTAIFQGYRAEFFLISISDSSAIFAPFIWQKKGLIYTGY